jgi:type VI protein secretion system component VasK
MTMTGLDYFAWVVFVTIIVASVAVVVALCRIPGKIAVANNHPQAKAINIAGWLGLLLSFGVIWVIAIIWAKSTPTANNKTELAEMKASIKALQAEVEAMKGDTSC